MKRPDCSSLETGGSVLGLEQQRGWSLCGPGRRPWAGGPATGNEMRARSDPFRRYAPTNTANGTPHGKALESERQGYILWFHYLLPQLSLGKFLDLAGPQFPHLYNGALCLFHRVTEWE